MAIFGAIFSNVLAGNLARHLRGAPLPAGFTSRGITPALLARLPAAIHHAIAAAYADAIHTVFLIAVPIGAVAFAATLFIPRIELRTWPTVSDSVPHSPATPAEDGLRRRRDRRGASAT